MIGDRVRLTAGFGSEERRVARVGLVCVAAGRGRRFGGDKLGQLLGGRPVLEVSLRALVAACPGAPLVIVVAPERVAEWRERLGPELPDARWVPGGELRQDSVRAGIRAAVAQGCDTVCVHDAARPLVHRDDVRAVVAAVGGDVDGALLCREVADTVKRVDSDHLVVETVPREALRLALTPQVVRVAAYESAWQRVGGGRLWTDESALLEAAGFRVRAVVATHPNPKLTAPDDLDLVRALDAGEAHCG